MPKDQVPAFLQKGILNHENALCVTAWTAWFDHDLAERLPLRERAFEPRERSTAKEGTL